VSAPASADGWRCETLTTWGRVRHARTSALAAPASDAALAAALTASATPVIAYGVGRCYGDAALNGGARTLLSRRRNRILAVESDPPALGAEAGVSFDELSAALHPAG
jgi:decaprenylphospho-beta-D-ribofuranose 2-oxidase